MPTTPSTVAAEMKQRYNALLAETIVPDSHWLFRNAQQAFIVWMVRGEAIVYSYCDTIQIK